MNLLFTGKGTSGSWAIRGVQIAEALGGKAIPMASLEECKKADVIIGVKRIPDALLINIRKSGRPFIWDCVDSYPQPLCSTWDEVESLAWANETLARLKPYAVIWPNARMQNDVGGGEVIYHHARPGIKRNPIRERIEVIGYEGSPKYIESWLPTIEAQCRKREFRFVLNPISLADVDVVLALRGEGWNGYPQRHWKSNVKLANAHASGTPFIGAPEDGYIETSTHAEYWATKPEGLSTALDWLEERDARQEISRRFLNASIPIEQTSEHYRTWIEALKF